MLESRIPEIIAGMGPKVNGVIHESVKQMAADAASNAPDAPPLFEGLPASIKVEEDVTFTYGSRSKFSEIGGDYGYQIPSSRGRGSVKAYGIVAAWYWYFLEFGTSKMAPRPFMIPAVEREKPVMIWKLKRALKHL